MTNPLGATPDSAQLAADAAAEERALQKRTRLKAGAAAIAIVALIVLLLTTPPDSVLAKGYAIAAGVLVLVKEILTAFARDRGLAGDKPELENWAAIASLFAVVFGVPAVAAVIF
jgi:uncharacterized membrane protein